jgi:serine-type D-Ala-D-Ala carboxypeptidase (penicillin-binding protein 5/6)
VTGLRRPSLGASLALSVLLALVPMHAVDAQAPVQAASLQPSTLDLPVGDAGFARAGSGLSVLLVEAATGQHLTSQDAQRVRPIASTIKLVTALAVIDAIPPRSLIDVGDEVIGIDGAQFGLRPGEQWSVEDLLAALLLRSGNEVAVTLAVAVAGSERAFIDRMVAVLMRLGIEGVRPGSSTGLLADDAMSAEQLAVVARAALAEPRLASIVGLRSATASGRDVDLANRNLLVGSYEGATGLKTGYTDAAGYTLAASARRDGRELIAIVLGAASEQERLAIAQRLLDHGFDRTEQRQVGGEIELRTGSGRVLLTTPLRSITTTRGASVELGWPTQLRGTDLIDAVTVLIDRRVVGSVAVVRVDARTPHAGTASLGQGLADGTYTALRAASLNGLLG